MYKIVLHSVVLAALFFGGARIAYAQPILIGSTTNAFGQPVSTSKIVDVGINSGNLTNPRDTGIRFLTGIAVQPGSGNLFGLTSFASTPANSLITIDVATGLPTVVGATGLQIVEGDLAFNPTNGMLYGLQADGPNSTTRNLFRIDPNSGIGIIVGNLANSGDFSSLAFDVNGVLYSIDSGGTGNSVLVTIDPGTAFINSSVTMNVNLGASVGMAFDPVSGMAFVGDSAASPASGGTNSLYTLNVANGMATLIGPTNDQNGLSGIAFVAVPEPGSLMLFTVIFPLASWRHIPKLITTVRFVVKTSLDT